MEKDLEFKKMYKAYQDQAPELLSLQEIEQQISSKQSKLKKQIKIMTYSILTAGIITIGIGLTGLSDSEDKSIYPLNPSTNSVAVNQNTARELSQLQTEEVKIFEKSASAITKALSIEQSLPSSHDYQSETKFFASLIDTNFVQVNVKDSLKTASIHSTKYPFIRLNEDELYQLGIVAKDHGVFYQETYNTQKRPFKYSIIKMENTVQTSFEGGNIQILSHPDKYPKLITNLTLSSGCGMLNRSSLSDTLDILLNYKSYLPIVVPINNIDIDSPGVDAEIFWFPKSNYVLNLLPAWAQRDLNKNPDAYAWDMRTNRKYNDDKVIKNTSNDEKIPLIKNNQYLSLNEAQLGKLGFKRDSLQRLEIKLKARRFKYYSFFKNGAHYIDIVSNNEKSYNRAKKKYKFPIPAYISDSLFNAFLNNISSLKKNEDFSEQKISQIFFLDRPNLLPVQITFQNHDVDYFWYEPSDSFFAILNEEQKLLAQMILKDSALHSKQWGQNINTKINQVTLEDIHQIYQKKFTAINPLILGQESLAKMGYKRNENNLEITIKDTLNKAVKLTLFKHGTTIDQTEIDSNQTKELIAADYISDDLGKYTYVSLKNKIEPDASKIDFNHLIPVLFETKRSYNAIDLFNHAARPNYLLWFKPNSKFFSLLPKETSMQIQNELDTIKKVPCVYTDICKENKINITKITAYPNPNKGHLNLKVEWSKPIDFSYSITDLSGKVVIESTVKEYDNSVPLDLDLIALENGIYYLYVYTNSGDLIVQKIVVMK